VSGHGWLVKALTEQHGQESVHVLAMNASIGLNNDGEFVSMDESPDISFDMGLDATFAALKDGTAIYNDEDSAGVVDRVEELIETGRSCALILMSGDETRMHQEDGHDVPLQLIRLWVAENGYLHGTTAAQVAEILPDEHHLEYPFETADSWDVPPVLAG
jgi:hypothetical protein